MASVWVSCTGASSEGMFGKIPQLYEDAQAVMIERAKSELGKAGKTGDGWRLLDMMKEEMEEAGKKAKPLAEAMKGKTVAYTESDSLPYRIASDITIKAVRLPSFSLIGNDDRTKLKAEFDIVVKDTIEGRHIILYYFLSGDKGNIAAGTKGVSGGKSLLLPGDTLHVNVSIHAPHAPARLLGKCQRLDFITRAAADAQKSTLKKQQEQWRKELRKELGLD